LRAISMLNDLFARNLPTTWPLGSGRGSRSTWYRQSRSSSMSFC
jgi:hypothetical protein